MNRSVVFYPYFGGIGGGGCSLLTGIVYFFAVNFITKYFRHNCQEVVHLKSLFAILKWVRILGHTTYIFKIQAKL